MMQSNGPNRPTPIDRTAGTAAVNRDFAAETLRRLARRHLGELDHAHLPITGEGEDNNVSIVAVDRVQAWLEGWAVRLSNGQDA